MVMMASARFNITNEPKKMTGMNHTTEAGDTESVKKNQTGAHYSSVMVSKMTSHAHHTVSKLV